ncbi:methyltransferase domain-containing protein [Candidatus Accumulibacter sp. ACC003]|uniref:methyltransferase domain-containing protein n=1 Tax=Candidatus Accumulibacter sp. ACC003 TaxID=2823334 RepID=UPI0025BA50D8|nr:methyltransferase domain-containing protein [Candidatus Accumulibacter sp. ACC003]
MTQYQSFPGVKGASESLAKLKALRLPSFQGKRFLDVGCNEGYFCGYARFDGAAEVIGIDRSKLAVSRAQARMPDCRFLVQSWEQLPDGKFDVILLASALHYADDQEALIHRLMDSLSDDGTLVLEMGIAPSGKSEWISVKRSIDERLFPSRGKLAEILQDYAWKIIGYSVQQAGDPLTRYVVHVRRQKPCVFLLLEPPGSGKTTLCRTLFARAKVPVVSGDLTYRQLSDGRITASEALKSLICADFSPQYDKVAEKVFSQGLAGDLVEVWCRQGGESEFVIDSYVPERYQQDVKDAFDARGYIPVVLNWEMQKSMSGPGDADKKASRYMETLVDSRVGEAVGMGFRVTRVNSPALGEFFSGWHLDQPVNGQIVTEHDQFTLSGWGLPRDMDAKAVRCYVRSAGVKQVFKLEKRRDDVVKLRLKDQVEVPETLSYCGFAFSGLKKSDLVSGIEFGFIANGQEIPAAQLGITEPVSGKATLSRKLLSKVGATLRRRR